MASNNNDSGMASNETSWMMLNGGDTQPDEDYEDFTPKAIELDDFQGGQPTPKADNVQADAELSDGVSILSEPEPETVDKFPLMYTHIDSLMLRKMQLMKRKVKRSKLNQCRRRTFLRLHKQPGVQIDPTNPRPKLPLPKLFVAFLVLVVIAISTIIVQYSINWKNTEKINDLLNLVENASNELSMIHKDVLQLKNEIKSMIMPLQDNKDENKTEFDIPIAQETPHYIEDRRNDWKDGHKYDNHQYDYKKKNTENHFQYDKYSNEKYAKGETFQDDNRKHFNNNDKKNKDFDYKKENDRDNNNEWYQKMMENRQRYRTEKQDKEKYNWYIQKGNEREKIRNHDSKYRD